MRRAFTFPKSLQKAHKSYPKCWCPRKRASFFNGGSDEGYGTLQWLYFTDSHSKQNENLGGRVNPVAYAYSQLPTEAKNDSLFILLGGDYWNENNALPQNGVDLKNELVTLGVDRIYGLEGNHDWYNNLFNLYVDPLGANTATSTRNSANFPLPIVGDRRAYYIKKGNLLNILMSDNQNFASPQGEDLSDYGSKLYNASGGYSETSWRWLIKTILSNLDCNLVINTHHPLKNTTAASGFLEGVTAGVTYIDPTTTTIDFEVFRGSYMAFIENVLSEKKFVDLFQSVNGSITAYFSGHLHIQIDEVINGRSWTQEAFGTRHINACCVNDKVFNVSFRSVVTPNSKVISVTGSAMTVKTHLHITDGIRPTGYQADLELSVPLQYAYNEDYISDDPTAPATPSITSTDNSVSGCATLTINKGSAHGILIVWKVGSHATFTPSADTAYFRGDTAVDGTVAYMGSVNNFQEYGLFGGDYYFTVWSFNGKNDKIEFCATPVQTNFAVSSATQAKILADMALDGGSAVLYLDSRVGVTTVSGGVSSWADQSGNGLNAVQGTAGNRPIYDAVNLRVPFTTAGAKYLTIPYNALHYFGYAPQPTWLIDVPFSIFAKVRMTDATGFRICCKITGTNFEFQLVTNSSDKLAIFLYDANSLNVAAYLSNIALTAFEGDDIFVFMNYHGGRKFTWGGMKLYVYDKDFNLIANDNLDSTGSAGNYAKIRNSSSAMEIGRNSPTAGADYSDGQINGLVIKRGNIFERSEMNYLMDHFSFADDI